MSLAEQEIKRETKQLAEILLKEAAENEPQITADLEEIARKVSAEPVGLKNKFKTKDSLDKKTHRRIDKKCEKFSGFRLFVR